MKTVHQFTFHTYFHSENIVRNESELCNSLEWTQNVLFSWGAPFFRDEAEKALVSYACLGATLASVLVLSHLPSFCPSGDFLFNIYLKAQFQYYVTTGPLKVETCKKTVQEGKMVHPKNDSLFFLYHQRTLRLSSSLFPLGNAKNLILNTFYVQTAF